MRSIISLLIVLGLVASSLFGLWSLSQQPDTATKPAVGTTPQGLPADHPYTQLALLNEGTFAPKVTVATATQGRVDLPIESHDYTVVIFYQGRFCGVCGAQLEGFQARLDEFEAADAAIVAISADTLEDATATRGERGLSFYIAADPEREAITRFGVPNRAKGNMAYPAVYVINAEGRVALAYADPTGKRLQASDVLAFLKDGTLPEKAARQ